MSELTRTNLSTGGKLEEAYGYSRAVRVGDVIRVSGTCSTGEGGAVHGVGDAGAQTARCFEIIGAALEAAGSGLGDIVMNRVYLKNIEDAEAVGTVMGALFKEVRPCCTLIAAGALVHPDFLVEIETEAVTAADVSA